MPPKHRADLAALLPPFRELIAAATTIHTLALSKAVERATRKPETAADIARDDALWFRFDSACQAAKALNWELRSVALQNAEAVDELREAARLALGYDSISLYGAIKSFLNSAAWASSKQFAGDATKSHAAAAKKAGRPPLEKSTRPKDIQKANLYAIVLREKKAGGPKREILKRLKCDKDFVALAAQIRRPIDMNLIKAAEAAAGRSATI